MAPHFSILHTSDMDDMAPNALCRGDNGTCDCEEYQPPNAPMVGDKVLCQEYHHGKSKHPRPTQSSSARGPLSAQSDGNQDVMSIFNAHSKGTTSKNSHNFQFFNKENLKSVTLGSAHSEAIAGFRPEDTKYSESKLKVWTKLIQVNKHN